jgi:hypothetical protein
MANHGYNKPSEGTLDWNVPLNDNFDQLERDIEVRDVEANMGDYQPDMGAKFLATDSGATYVGDGTDWNLVGYVTRTVGGDPGHYVEYEDGLTDATVNTFLFGSGEKLSVFRVSFPMKGVSAGATDSDLTLRVYEGGTDGTLMLELDGNDFRDADSDSAGPWVASSSPVTVTVSNASGGPVEAVPKVWANVRQ